MLKVSKVAKIRNRYNQNSFCMATLTWVSYNVVVHVLIIYYMATLSNYFYIEFIECYINIVWLLQTNPQHCEEEIQNTYSYTTADLYIDLYVLGDAALIS